MGQELRRIRRRPLPHAPLSLPTALPGSSPHTSTHPLPLRLRPTFRQPTSTWPTASICPISRSVDSLSRLCQQFRGCLTPRHLKIHSQLDRQPVRRPSCTNLPKIPTTHLCSSSESPIESSAGKSLLSRILNSHRWFTGLLFLAVIHIHVCKPTTRPPGHR